MSRMSSVASLHRRSCAIALASSGPREDRPHDLRHGLTDEVGPWL